jgi:pyruvate,water dikinase
LKDVKDFGPFLSRVLAALPGEKGARLGAVFVQPLLDAEEAGVAFFDGFYYERTLARGSNEGLTSGRQRGEVSRGHQERGDSWSAWLESVYSVFGGPGGDARLDLEFALDETGYVLLQVRPALFPLRRNPTLSLANHKEILGDPPSPWMVAALVEAGRDLSFPALADPAIESWEEVYAVEAAERAWLNVSFWYRWMDHFGLPRTLVTEGVGGSAEGPLDGRMIWGRFLASIPRLIWFQLCCLRLLPGLPAAFGELDREIEEARGLGGLHRATVAGLTLALRGNFAINAVLSGWSKARRFLRLRGSARVVTQEMMEEYARLSALPAGERESGLDGWLSNFGHRGPLESDLARPRFAELREALLRDLGREGASVSGPTPAQRGGASGMLRPLYWIDERREWFRDSLMRRWQRLRGRILEEAGRLIGRGELDRAEDVFWLRPSEFDGPAPLRQVAAAGRARVEAARRLDLPHSAPLEEIQELLTKVRVVGVEDADRREFPGIALSQAVFEGRALKADDLMTLLSGEGGEMGPGTVLVVPALEPSWAVVFPRVGGVVAELGGELSHASILLREAGRPAVVNCAGVFARVRTGDRLRLDGRRGVVEILG